MKTKEEIFNEMVEACPFRVGHKLKPYILEAMELHKSPTPKVTDGEIEKAFPLEVDKNMFKASRSYDEAQKHRREGAKWMRDKAPEVSEDLKYIDPKCQCKESAGSTAIDCCNICGYPLQSETWHFVKSTPQDDAQERKLFMKYMYHLGKDQYEITDLDATIDDLLEHGLSTQG